MVLAAGRSSRLGQPKQIVRLGDEPGSTVSLAPGDSPNGEDGKTEGETLLERAVRVAAEAGLRPVYLVAERSTWLKATLARLHGAPVVWVENTEAAEGMAASIRLGVNAARKADAVIVMTCDQPAVTPEHLARLTRVGDRVVASTYAGRKGVPAYFPASSFAALMALKGDAGARELLREAEAITLPLGEVDVDTPDDLALARRLFGSMY